MLFDRRMYGDWAAAGSKDIVAVAHEKVEDVLKNHQVKPIDSDILKDMKAIVDRADKAFKGM
jgi:trimethylamine--corrinoid protein Co-methyltransferase